MEYGKYIALFKEHSMQRVRELSKEFKVHPIVKKWGVRHNCARLVKVLVTGRPLSGAPFMEIL